MNIPVKTLKSGFSMPVFGFGTWQMGGRHERDPQNDDQADIAAIKAAIEAGITHIDTAESYSAGHAEELVAQAIKGYDRSKLFIVSKAHQEHLRHDDLLVACENSLKRLQIDYLDLYLLHAPSLQVPIKETMAAMDKLKADGRIKNIGISNFSIKRTKEAVTATQNQIVANQLHLNLMYREPERDGLVEYCQQNDMLFIAWRPVQKGALTQPGHYPILDEMCAKYQKTPSQIAINWLISQENIITLAKSTNLEHLEENLGALGWQMDKNDMERLDKEFPDQKDISDAVPLL
ncbi:MAG TPA: aldo/keto reductase [Patescibacteria group bacterium]|nr:aldo/keto reductase [Patescibacteria group bacterium]